MVGRNRSHPRTVLRMSLGRDFDVLYLPMHFPDETNINETAVTVSLYSAGMADMIL